MSNLFNAVINGRQFNFQPFEIGAESGYHTDVKDEHGKRWEFRLFHSGEKNWRIDGEQLPEWITALEQELSRAVNAHE